MRILLLSPHTDDIELGAGGLVSRLQEEGGHVFRWLVFSRCEDSLPAGMPPDTLEREFLASAEVYGIADTEVFNFAVRTMPSYRQEILETLVATRREFKPDMVIAPCTHDVHQDHATIAAEAVRAYKSSATLLGYELPWNNLAFDSTVLVRLTKDHMWRKWEAMQQYSSQLALGRDYFSWEFVQSWGRSRGVQCGAEYAEAFEVIRAIW